MQLFFQLLSSLPARFFFVCASIHSTPLHRDPSLCCVPVPRPRAPSPAWKPPLLQLDALVAVAHDIPALYLAEHFGEKADHLGADDFLPIFIYVLVNSKVEGLAAQSAVLEALCDPKKMMGEAGESTLCQPRLWCPSERAYIHSFHVCVFCGETPICIRRGGEEGGERRGWVIGVVGGECSIPANIFFIECGYVGQHGIIDEKQEVLVLDGLPR